MRVSHPGQGTGVTSLPIRTNKQLPKEYNSDYSWRQVSGEDSPLSKYHCVIDPFQPQESRRHDSSKSGKLRLKTNLLGGRKGKDTPTDDHIDSSDVLVMCGPGDLLISTSLIMEGSISTHNVTSGQKIWSYSLPKSDIFKITSHGKLVIVLFEVSLFLSPSYRSRHCL